jgi:hypothetical protein
MKKLGFLAVFILSLIIFKINVSALSDACTVAEQKRLQNLVAATKISYEFTDDNTYSVTITNFSPDFYVYNEEYGLLLQYVNSPTVTTSGLVGGENYNFPFFATNSTACEGYEIFIKSVKLIAYNEYSEDPLCDGYENYELCKKFTQIKIDSYDEFVQRLKAYIASLKSNNNEPIIDKPVEVNKTLMENIKDFIATNYMILLISIIILGTSGIIIIEVKKRRSIL